MYNVAQYLEKCIGSIYKQGMNENEFEVILIDDGSPDNSYEVANKLTATKTNVTIIRQNNKGLGGARNTGIHNAKGEFLLFLDADDWILSNTCLKVLDSADRLNVDVLEFASQGITSQGKIVYYISNSSNRKVFNGFEYYKAIRYMHSACNKLYKREFLIQNNLFFLENIFIEDFEFNTRVFSKASRVAATTVLMAQFLQSSNSITRNKNQSQKRKMISDIKLVLEKIKNEYKIYEHSESPVVHSFFKERLGFVVSTLFVQMIKSGATYAQLKNLRQELKENQIFFVDNKIYQKEKELFRQIFLKHFYLLRLIDISFLNGK